MEGLQRQDVAWGSFEIVVVDNGSTDDTRARAAARGVTVVDEPRVGVGFARNAGIRAAGGDVIAFVDADSVPDPRWLAEILAGADDPSIGCFVGEIVPLDRTNPVARYVDDRRLISQVRLLSGAPPAAATGSVAYRRAVFAAVGLFDERLPGGEDNDLFWRMVKTDRFRVRYNARAVVAHAHPATLVEFARRSYREGVALGAFRLKHGDDLPHTMTSRRFVAAALARTVGGIVLYPGRVWRSWRIDGVPLATALRHRMLDKIGSTGRVAGVARALFASRRAVVDENPVLGDAAAGVVGGAHVAARIDRLHLDLDTAPLLAGDASDLRERVRRDLRALAEGIEAEFPGASIVLTGSLFAGEGRVTRTGRDPEVASDYDLFVVTGHPWHAWPPIARRKLDRVMRAIGPLAAAADVGFVWTPLARHRKTTLGGAVVAGSGDVVDILPSLPAPCGVSALLQAYEYLTAAPLDPTCYSDLAAKALVRAARALLLADARGLPRPEWIGLTSIAVVCERIAEWRDVLGAETIDAIVAAGEHLLGRATLGPSPADHVLHCTVLRSITARMPRVDSKVVAAKHLLWRITERRVRHPVRVGPRPVLEAFQALAESWSSDGALRPSYEADQRLLSRVATFNPHRFVYLRGGAVP